MLKSEPLSGPVRTLEVTADEAEMRLDRWFKRHFPALTHGHIQKLLRTGQIRLDGKRTDSAARLAAGQVIRIPPQLEGEKMEPGKQQPFLPRVQIEKLQELILFQDEDVVVLNKPAGLAVQGGTGLKENLDDMLMAFSLDGKTRPKLVHRLDRETSGVFVVARTPFAATRLTEAFRTHDIQKIYWAVTLGVPHPAQGIMEEPLVKEGEKMRVAAFRETGAKDAATLYKVVATTPDKMSFVALAPLTGRTHQLRVHLAQKGTPIWGDRLYGGADPSLSRASAAMGRGLHLHARRLVVPHPRSGIIDVVAPLGAAMLKTWRWFQFDENADVAFEDLLNGRR